MKNKLGRNSVTCLVSLIVLAAYNILYFVIPFNRDLSGAAFWISYGVTNFLILFNLFTIYLGFKDKSLRSRVFGIPIVTLGVYYTIIQFVADILIMSIGSFVKIPYWVVVVFEVLLLATAFISLIARKAYKDAIITIDTKEEKEDFIKDLRIQLDTLVHASMSDAQLRNDLRKLYETVKYTNPVSKKCVYEIEDDISTKVAALRKAVQDENVVKAKGLIDDITNLIRERKARLSV